MEVSVIRLKKKTRKQGNAYEILKWLKSHPEKLHNTNCTFLAKAMKLDKDFELNMQEEGITQSLEKMLRRGWIKRYNGIRRASFAINYLHPDIPTKIKEGMIISKEEAEALPTETNGESSVSEQNESRPVEDKEIVKDIVETVVPDIEETKLATPETISVKTGDGEIKLSITLNININR